MMQGWRKWQLLCSFIISAATQASCQRDDELLPEDWHRPALTHQQQEDDISSLVQTMPLWSFPWNTQRQQQPPQPEPLPEALPHCSHLHGLQLAICQLQVIRTDEDSGRAAAAMARQEELEAGQVQRRGKEHRSAVESVEDLSTCMKQCGRHESVPHIITCLYRSCNLLSGFQPAKQIPRQAAPGMPRKRSCVSSTGKRCSRSSAKRKRRWGDAITTCINSHCSALDQASRFECIVNKCNKERRRSGK